jgi:heterodisulfide reductase subunit C
MTLRTYVKRTTGQDLQTCQSCADCDGGPADDMDIPISSLVQLILLNDEEALQCRTLWSDSALEASRGACKRGLDLCAVMLALREEAIRKAGE